MACNCGKGTAHSEIGTTVAHELASQLRARLSEHHVAEPLTVVCVEDDTWELLTIDPGSGNGPFPKSLGKHNVSKIVVTFHNVSDVQWLTEQLARQPNRP